MLSDICDEGQILKVRVHPGGKLRGLHGDYLFKYSVCTGDNGLLFYTLDFFALIFFFLLH